MEKRDLLIANFFTENNDQWSIFTYEMETKEKRIPQNLRTNVFPNRKKTFPSHNWVESYTFWFILNWTSNPYSVRFGIDKQHPQDEDFYRCLESLCHFGNGFLSRLGSSIHEICFSTDDTIVLSIQGQLSSPTEQDHDIALCHRRRRRKEEKRHSKQRCCVYQRRL